MSIDDQRDLPTKGSGATTTGTEDRGCRIADRESSRGEVWPEAQI
jgi:hypothetical protein